MKDSIGNWRKKIDSLDAKIVKLLDQRIACAVEIGKIKAATGAPVFDPAREAQVIARISGMANVIPKRSLEAIYREIFSGARAVEKTLSIAYLGPAGTFSNEAAAAIFGASCEFHPFPAFDQVVRAVEKGECNFGVLPIENSVEGPVNANLDLLKDSPLSIMGEKSIAAHQNLVSPSKSLKGIQRLYSHVQPLGQCRKSIARLLPGVEIHDAASTTAAAARAAKDKQGAAICSAAAARVYKLNVLEKNIEDSPNNRTRFVVVGNGAPGASGSDKTSIAVAVKNRPGELYRLLGIFSKAKINLSQIAARPLKAGSWGYLFFIDLDGHRDDKAVAKVLKQVQRMCDYLKILGSYPKENH